jgi:hypothetical protein
MRLARSLIAILVALFTSAAVGQVVGRIGIGVASASSDAISAAAIGVVILFFLVPIVAGVILGVLAPTRPGLLAVPLVILSLLVTFLSLGSVGLPRGWKIAEYMIQTVVIALVATVVASRRRRAAQVASAG